MRTLIICFGTQHPKIISPCIHAARTISNADMLLFGHKTEGIVGVDQLIHYPNLTHISIEKAASIIQDHIKHYTHILLHSDTLGMHYISYLSGYFNIPSLTHISHILSPSTYQCIYQKQSHTIQMHHTQTLLAISGLYFRKTFKNKPNIITMDKKSRQSINKTYPTKACISIGHGALSHVQDIQKLSLQWDADVYGSKPIIDKKRLETYQLMGISGKVVQSPLFIAIGLAGDDYHMHGIDASITIAINPDPHAPIFQYADYGYVGHIQDILPLLEKYKLCVDIIA